MTKHLLSLAAAAALLRHRHAGSGLRHACKPRAAEER